MEANSETHRGVILWYSDSKKYGFLTDLDTRLHDYFFHKSALPDGTVPHMDDRVTFTPDVQGGRTCAKNIKFL